MSYTIVPYSEIKPGWDAFCADCASAWFFHTTGWIEYTASMPLSGPSENLSFAVADGNRLLALVPLIKECLGDQTQFAYGGWNIPFPAFLGSMGAAERKAVEKFVFETVRTGSAVDYACFYVCGLSEEVLDGSLRVNPIAKHGFHDTTISTYILNLQREDEEALYRGFRKGCKSDIKTAQKRGFKVLIVDGDNYEARYFDCYRSIHREAAGRQTRTDASWEKQRSWLQVGHSVLALLEKDGTYVSAAFINTYKDKAYYQSAGTLPSFEGERGAGHLVHWELIRYLKRKNYRWYETGNNYCPNVSQEVADEKLLGISRFKASFGADLYPLFRGERFGTMDNMKQVYLQRLAAYESLAEQALQFNLGTKPEEAVG
jgi:hypothetical protein